jgi:methionyl-tRNA formyltransferase
MKRIVVIGNGGFAGNCLRRLLARREEVAIALVVSDPEVQAMRGLLERFCADHDVAYAEATEINTRDLIERIRVCDPDYLLSIYNMRIMKSELLAVPRLGTINFHNGPLPRYRGVNVYSWAIINGEKEFGVTWHLVDRGIDTGDVLAQGMFPIEASDTPTSLMAKGFRTGVELLEALLPALCSETLAPRKQDESLARYFARADLPNGGRLSVHWSFDRIERFVRGLDFRPLPNTFVHPTVSFRGQCFHPQAVACLDAARISRPGRVMGVDDSAIHVQVEDAVIGISDLLDSKLRSVDPRELQQRLGIEVGDFLDPDEQGTGLL